jgi:hypothetical protein
VEPRPPLERRQHSRLSSNWSVHHLMPASLIFPLWSFSRVKIHSLRGNLRISSGHDLSCRKSRCMKAAFAAGNQKRYGTSAAV